LDRFSLPAQLDQRGNGIERVEEEMRLKLHLERAQMGGRELALQLQSLDRIALGADLQLGDCGDAEDESVQEDFEAEAIDIEKVLPNGQRGGVRLPVCHDETQAAQEQQMRDAQPTAGEQIEADGAWRKAEEGWRALSQLPHGGANQTPPSPEHDAVQKRW
jgi:hypothetical protein